MRIVTGRGGAEGVWDHGEEALNGTPRRGGGWMRERDERR